MIGIIDESTPWLTDDRDEVLYSLALVVIADELHDDVGTRLRSSMNRKRPFHWESDVGPKVRAKLIDELTECASAIVVAAAGCQRKDQTETRRSLLDRLLLPAAFESVVPQLVIERQSRAENEADVRTVRDWSRASSRGWRPMIDHVDKIEPLTWLADAASGLWSDALLDRDRGALAPLVGSRLIRSATWTPRTER
jgi:hypothetical protein